MGLVTGESKHEGHVEVVPNFDSLIPRSSDANGWLCCVVELNAGDSVGVLVLVDGVLAFRTCVPNLDLMIETTCDDLSVIG